MKITSFLVAGLMSIEMLVPSAGVKAQAEPDCNHPADVSEIPRLFLGITVSDGIKALSGFTVGYATSSHRCDNLTEKGPRALSLYKNCPNVACQLGLEANGIGVVAAIEQNMKDKLKSCMPSNCDTWFGLIAKTGYTSVDPGRTQVKGWHRLALNLFGGTLPFPVQRFQAQTFDGPLALQQTYGVPFHASRWAWDQRSAMIRTPPIPLGLVGTLEMTVTNTDAAPVAGRVRGSKEQFFNKIQQGDFPVSGSSQKVLLHNVGDWSDWDWYLQPSSFWKSLDLSSSWELDFDIAPHATSFDFPFGKVRLSAFAAGTGTAVFHHQEDTTWKSIMSPSGLPNGIFVRPGALNTANAEIASASLKGGVRIRVKAAWFSWTDEWSLPSLSGSGSPKWSASRETAAFQVLGAAKVSSAVTLTLCDSKPAAMTPAWVKESVGSPVAAPDDDADGDLIAFGTTVSKAVVDSFVVCPAATPSASDLQTLDAIRRAYLADKASNPILAKQRACTSLTPFLRRYLALCQKGPRGESVRSTRYTRGEARCEISI